MRLNSIAFKLIFLLFLCQCSFFDADRNKDHKNIIITCVSNNCQINNKTVIIVLNNNDCQRCTEKVERIGEIISEKTSKKRVVIILKNYDKNSVVAYKRSLSRISDQILEDENEVTIHSDINGMSHFIVFDDSIAKYKSFLPDQFRELSDFLNN
jgi:GTPase involved in cell partitioning and DNA repair